jgi:hypothetical protein
VALVAVHERVDRLELEAALLELCDELEPL